VRVFKVGITSSNMRGHHEAVMRLLLFMLGISAGIVATGNRAEAQNYPWCAMLNMVDQTVNCGFVSVEQCMASVSGIGGYCMPSNTFQLPRPIARRSRTSLRWART
jgi:hypothetical protein